MAGSRKSTPARARSTSVVSNASEAASSKAPASPRSPKSPKVTKATKSTPKSPAATKATKSSAASPATPRKSTKARSDEAADEETLTAAQKAAIKKRPALPAEKNPELPNEDFPVKLQIIVREDASIVIGRVKLPAPGPPGKGPSHGFLLKRFDTGGVAASSMFQLAFPFAGPEHEKAEMEYVEARYDAVASNGGTEKVPAKRPRGRPSKKTLEAAAITERLPEGSTGVRLQGTWIPSADALKLAKEYGILRYARPLIEAKATVTKENVPVLIPAADDTISTPTSGRSKKALKNALGGLEETLSPSASRKRVKASETSSSSDGILHTGLTAEQIEKQIKEGQDIVKNVIANGVQAVTGTPTSSRKRRAVNQSPSARTNVLDDQDDYEGNAVSRSFRRGARVARRRPIVTTAGALGAVGAVGAGTLAWLAGGNLDVATQLLQQGVQNLGSWLPF